MKCVLEINKTKHQQLQTAFRKALKSLSFFMCDVRLSRHYNTRIGLQTAHKKRRQRVDKKAFFAEVTKRLKQLAVLALKLYQSEDVIETKQSLYCNSDVLPSGFSRLLYWLRL